MSPMSPVQAMYVGPNDDLYCVPLANFDHNPPLANQLVDMGVFALVADAVRQRALSREPVNLDQAIEEVIGFIDRLVSAFPCVPLRWRVAGGGGIRRRWQGASHVCLRAWFIGCRRRGRWAPTTLGSSTRPS